MSTSKLSTKINLVVNVFVLLLLFYLFCFLFLFCLKGDALLLLVWNISSNTVRIIFAIVISW